MLEWADRAAAYAETDRGADEAWFNDIASTPKIEPDALTVYVLRRLLLSLSRK
jgi:hypothetical protein